MAARFAPCRSGPRRTASCALSACRVASCRRSSGGGRQPGCCARAARSRRGSPTWATTTSRTLPGRDETSAAHPRPDPQWQNTIVIDHDPIEVIRDLRQQPGADIVQYGFGRLSHALMAVGLLDELRLWVHPFFVGIGSASDLLYRAGSSGSFELV